MGLVFIPIPKKSNAKECSNCGTIALISYASKGMLKSFKLEQLTRINLQNIQAAHVAQYQKKQTT